MITSCSCVRSVAAAMVPPALSWTRTLAAPVSASVSTR